jgi:hypothetical protein
VLAKRIDCRVRSVKVLGWIGSRESNRSRGSRARSARHKKRSQNYHGRQGLGCKSTLSSTSRQEHGQELLTYRNWNWRIKSTEFRAARGLGEMQNGERRSRGSQRCAHLGRRTTESAGFLRSTPAGELGTVALAAVGRRRHCAAGGGGAQSRSRGSREAAARPRAAPFMGARAGRSRPGWRRPWPADGPGGPGRPGAGAGGPERAGSGLRARPS